VPITRADIAKALDSVEGLRGNATPPKTPQPGDAWPVWETTGLATLGFGLAITWSVYVALTNADLDQTVAEADPLVEAVAIALSPLGALGLIEPYRVTSEGPNTIPAIRVGLETI
jgi:hypothetical protein